MNGSLDKTIKSIKSKVKREKKDEKKKRFVYFFFYNICLLSAIGGNDFHMHLISNCFVKKCFQLHFYDDLLALELVFEKKLFIIQLWLNKSVLSFSVVNNYYSRNLF